MEGTTEWLLAPRNVKIYAADYHDFCTPDKLTGPGVQGLGLGVKGPSDHWTVPHAVYVLYKHILYGHAEALHVV